MLNILLPTDFTADSFRLAEMAVRYFNCEMNLFLFHVCDLPDNYNDLLKKARPPYADMLNDQFRVRCKQLKDKYPEQLKKVSFLFMHGHSQSLFNHHIEANRIDTLVWPESYVFQKVHNRSIDPTLFFTSSSLPVVRQLVSPARKHREDWTIIREKQSAHLSTADMN